AQFFAHQGLGNHPDDAAALGHDGVGHDAHDAYACAAIHQANVAPHQLAGQFARAFGVVGQAARVGAAVHADIVQLHKGSDTLQITAPQPAPTVTSLRNLAAVSGQGGNVWTQRGHGPADTLFS